MEESESTSSPSGVFQGRGEEVHTGAMEILELRLKLSEGCIEVVKKMPHLNFNKKQCEYLADKLEVVVRVARYFLEIFRSQQYCGAGSSWNVTKWVGIFKLLLSSGKQIEDFMGECSKSVSVDAAMTLADASQYVSSLAFNLELCRVLFSEGECAAVQRGLTSVEVGNLYKAEADMVKPMASVDKEHLLKQLTLASDASSLAKHLLKRLCPIPTGDEGSTVGKSFESVKLGPHGEQLGKGSFATVYKATLLETPVAKKTFDGPENPFFLKEVEILSQLRHPNITSMFCSTMNKKNCSIVMELMDCDLLALIQNRCGEQDDLPPFSLSESLDLMLQIAEGVNYLHTKRIIHRDLKSKNILVKMMGAAELETRYMLVKVADFGLSKTKEMSASFSCMTYNQGTPRYMALELVEPAVAKSEAALNYKFKCDVYSFAMVCYEILTGKLPFKGQHLPEEIVQLVLKCKRPKLPAGCPALLKKLIEQCWITNPEERPSFGTICLTLKYLKYLFMRGDIILEGSEFRLDRMLFDGSGFAAKLVNKTCLSSVKVDVASPSMSKSEEVGNVLPTIISPLAAPLGGANPWVGFFSKAWFPNRRRDLLTCEAFEAATLAFPTLEEQSL